MIRLCERCKIALTRFGVKIDNLKLMIGYRCPMCHTKMFFEAEDGDDLSIKSSPTFEEPKKVFKHILKR